MKGNSYARTIVRLALIGLSSCIEAGEDSEPMPGIADNGLLCGLYDPDADGPPVITEPDLASWPRECIAEELPAVVVAQVEDDDDHEQVTVTFAGGMLTSFEGLPCHYCGFSEPYEFTTELFACSQDYVCDPNGDPFRVRYYILNSDAPNQVPTWNLVWEKDGQSRGWNLGPANVPHAECVPDCSESECGPDYCGGECGQCSDGEYCLANTCYADSEPSDPGDPDVPSNACDLCLESCAGLSSCCTGSGCLCQDACSSTDCGAGLELCCGWDGFCFCTDNCPY